MQINSLVKYLILVLACGFLAACGGGGTSDTSGALTMTAATSKDNGDGTYDVSTTVAYAPPTGKSAQGVVITITATDSFGIVTVYKPVLTSGSNSVNFTFRRVPQHVGSSNPVTIISSIGGMTASVGATIPASSALALSSETVAFVAADAALTKKTVVVSGGITPYTVLSSKPTDIIATISGTTVTIELQNVAGATPAANTATVTVTDALNATKTITVNYFK